MTETARAVVTLYQQAGGPGGAATL
jgi:hypothetical protein